jgi:four helix bundle protein
MADRINSFEELDAWKTAWELVRFAYSVFKRKPANHDFGLKSQVERAAVSAMTNVAEGFERVHSAEKLLFYNVARASCGEVRSLSYVMLDAAYISDAEHKKVMELVAQTGRLVSGLIRSTRARTTTPNSHLLSPIS